MWGPYGDHMSGVGWLMMVLMTIFWLLVLAGVILLVVWLARRYSTPGGGESALDILNKRYARGGISREEYERMKQDLSRGQG